MLQFLEYEYLRHVWLQWKLVFIWFAELYTLLGSVMLETELLERELMHCGI